MFSQGSTSPDLLDRRRSPDAYGTVTRCGRPFQIVRLRSRRRMARSHGLFRVRSPLLTESRLISFPPGTEMFQFPGFAPRGLCIQPRATVAGCPVPPGCPIRRSPDQSVFGRSPELFAAYNVLHRLCTPRHPPCTLTSLTTFRKNCGPAVNTRASTMNLSENTPDRGRPRRHGAPAPAIIGQVGLLYQLVRLSSSGADRDRTGNLRVANAALSRLSYGPARKTALHRSTRKWRKYSNLRDYARAGPTSGPLKNADPPAWHGLPDQENATDAPTTFSSTGSQPPLPSASLRRPARPLFSGSDPLARSRLAAPSRASRAAPTADHAPARQRQQHGENHDQRPVGHRTPCSIGRRLARPTGPDRIRTCDLVLIRDAL